MTNISTGSLNSNPTSGWTAHQDTEYTQLAPQSVTNGKIKLTCNDLGSLTNYSQKPIGSVTPFFNSATNLIEPHDLNDVLHYRITAQITPSNANVTGTITLEIEDTPKVIIGSKIITFPDSKERTLTLFTNSFVLANYINNGASIYVESEGGTLNLYDLRIFIERTHKGII